MTETTPAPAPALVPDASPVPTLGGWAAVERSPGVFSLTHETLGSVTVKVMDPADTLDLMEAAGAASTNEGYIRLAIMVSSVTELDGRPVPRPTTKDGLRALARSLGNEKLAAVGTALFGARAQEAADDAKETAKN